MVIYMRDTKGDTHIETESERMLGVPQKPAERTFHISLFILHPQPPPHIFPHTLVPFPILSLSCSSSPRHLQLRGEEMLKCQSDSENFLEKKLSLPSTPEQASFPPPSTTRSITFGIYLLPRISRQCNIKSSFVELLKCKFKSPFLSNIGI